MRTTSHRWPVQSRQQHTLFYNRHVQIVGNAFGDILKIQKRAALQRNIRILRQEPIHLGLNLA